MTAAGPLVLMGQTISTAGHLEATAGDVALVAGTEMTVQASPLSPLGITVMAGTQVGTAKISVDAHGQLKANSVILAGQADGTHALASDILLGIDSTATLEATGVNGRVILTTGSNPGTVAGVANINGLVTGTQTSNIASGGELSATGGVVLSGQNLISQTNNVTVSAGDYSITAAGKVTLGGTQAAHGVVTIVGHDIAHSGTVSLTANKDGAFSDATAAQGKLSVRATGGSIDLGTDSTIRGGTGHESEVHFETTISGADVTAGHVSGLELTGLENQTGDIITGDIDVDTALTLKTTGGNISTGGITVGGATPQDASVWSTTGDVSVIGDGSISGDYGVTAHGTATLGGTQKAHGTVTVEGADIANSGTLSLTANKDGAFSAGTAAQGKLTLTADTGGIDIGKGSTLNGRHHGRGYAKQAVGSRYQRGDRRGRCHAWECKRPQPDGPDGASGRYLGRRCRRHQRYYAGHDEWQCSWPLGQIQNGQCRNHRNQRRYFRPVACGGRRWPPAGYF